MLRTQIHASICRAFRWYYVVVVVVVVAVVLVIVLGDVDDNKIMHNTYYANKCIVASS